MSWSTILKNRQQIRAQVEANEEIAVMFSDIRGFASYTVRRGDRAAYRLSQLHETLLKTKIEERGGILVKTMGDGIIAAFPEAPEAIEAAVKIQEEIRSRNQETPEEGIDVGIGLSSGTPVLTESDMIGHSVNLSQRISSLAKGGQILVTEGIKDSAPLADSLRYIPLGERDLKGVGTERVYEVAWMGEVSRLSDGGDGVTLILTDRGTVVVELAKEVQGQIAEALEKLKNSHGEPETAFSALLQRVVAGFADRAVSRSLGAFGLGREHRLDQVDLSLKGKDVILRLGKKDLPLRGADPEAARRFLETLHQAKRTLPRPEADSST
ncbi:MAG: adenylate/guanylate cyclase domain-containing protein [Candidatus Bipolaricaulota bacterium]|nr:adenylate/guanylate cyclase domain-containing protein [Candidatus Bipolaricaulota bacterium]